MVTIFIWKIFLLPPALVGLAPWLSLSLTALFWIGVAWVVRRFVFALLRYFTRRTRTDIDDVLLDTTRRPFIGLLLLLGLYNSVEHLGFHDTVVDGVEKALRVGVIGVVTFWVWRIFREVVIYYGQRLAETTESSLDDVLLPIVNQISPIVIFLAGGLVALQYLGVNLDGVLVAIGGISFILAFALQDILSNIFSGLSLVVDTPFAYRDLIVLADGALCEVRRIGLRVTELYNVNSHSIIYMPNSQLANERLVNMTRPSPDLVDSITLSVEADADLEAVKEILESVALGHPDVLGDLDQKLAHLPAFASLGAGDPKRAMGQVRLQVEKRLDAKLLGIFVKIEQLVHRVRNLERGGLNAAEVRELERHFLPLLADFGMGEREKKNGQRKARAIEYNSDPNSLLGVVHEWITIWACDPDLGGTEDTRLDIAALWDETIEEPLNDHQLLVMQWNRRMRLLTKHLVYLHEKFADPSGVEQRLDDRLLDLAGWLRKNFKEPEPKWKGPEVSFNGPDDRGMSFTLNFFIDDIELEHFQRQGRVQRELRLEIVRRLRAAGIGLPFPQQVVHFHPGLKLPWVKV